MCSVLSGCISLFGVIQNHSQTRHREQRPAQTVKLLALNQSEFEEKATENRDWVSSVFSAKH